MLPVFSSVTTNDLSTSSVSWSSTWYRSTSPLPATARAASRSNPPMNTANRRNRICSGSVSNACDQSTEARKVCWRRTAVREPPVRRRKRSRRPSRISPDDSARTRAAASSIANGIPSSRSHISVTTARVSPVRSKSGRARGARSVNNSIASSASDNDGTRHIASPATASGSRLVVNSRTAGHRPMSA